MKFDGVVSFHHNAHTCGVARFNRYLADHLGVPMVRISRSLGERFHHLLVSIKASEMSRESLGDLSAGLSGEFALILHDYSDTPEEQELVRRATSVMALNQEMAVALREIRTGVIVGFSPGAAPSFQPRPEIDLRLITFGMAHKIQPIGYQIVGGLLESDPRSFVLEISSALHEGTDFDDEFFTVGKEISNSFGGNVEFLGFLADMEVSRRLANSDAMLAFFPRGARENNNSVASAMRHGLPVVTNLDEWSPDWMVHGETVFNVHQLEEFPDVNTLRRVGIAAQMRTEGLDYENLLGRFGPG